MKTNKKVFIAIPIVIALIVFIGLLIYFNKEDANSFNASERKWLQSHVNTRENFEVISDYPVYGDSGVFYKFISSLEKNLSKQSSLSFSEIPCILSSISFFISWVCLLSWNP